jgi:hypothetical protein
VCEGASERGSAHKLQAREKPTRKWPALSIQIKGIIIIAHQHACVRLGMQCMHALVLCV